MMVTFNKENHEYKNENGEVLISVTQLLKKHGLATDYSDVPQAVLQRAAEAGTVVHEAIESYVNEGTFPEYIEEVYDFIEWCKKYKLNPVRSEVMYADEMIAGTIDVICEAGNDVYDLIDTKTGSKVDIDACRWQLSLYKHLVEANGGKVRGLYVFQPKQKNKLVKVEPIDDGEVKRLLAAEATGVLYVKPAVPAAIMDIAKQLDSVELELAVFEETFSVLDAKRKEIMEKIKTAMRDNGIKKYETEHIAITYVPPTTRETFDSKAFKAACPETYSGYVKVSEVKDSVRIKRKEK